MRQKSESTFLLKMVSLLIALLIWFQISGRVRRAEAVQIRNFHPILLQYSNKPGHLEVKNETYQFQITIEGREQDLQKINASDLKVTLDLAGFNEGITNLPLTSDHVTLPQSDHPLKVTQILPQTAKINLVHWTTKTLPVHLFTDGQPAEFFEVKDIVLSPNKVAISGPTREVGRLEFVLGKNVDISEASEHVEGVVNFSGLLPENAYLVNSNVRYQILIEEITGNKTVRDLYPVEIEDDTYQLEKETKARLALSGPITVVKWFDPQWVVPMVEPIFENPSPVVDAPVVALENPIDTTTEEPQEVEEQPVASKGLVTTRWRLPDEIKQEHPDWLAKVSSLTLQWTPAEVTLKVKPSEEQ